MNHIGRQSGRRAVPIRQGHRGSKIVIGYDARRNSQAFAELTAAIAAAGGLTAEVLPRRLPTPVLAYAIKARGADAGVVVTASHNPPEDNGYKGLSRGRHADRLTGRRRDLRAHRRTTVVQPNPQSDNWVTLDESIVEQYLDRAVSLADPAKTGDARLTVVYSAMHGVGGGLFEDVSRRLGFIDLTPVAEQFEPDAAFPTVAFPNPEEPERWISRSAPLATWVRT